MQVVNDIRVSINEFINGVVFNYGRSADTALASAVLEINQWFVHLDPVTIEGELQNFERARIQIGFLLQDAPDSSYDANDTNLEIDLSIEEIQQKAKLKALEWANYFVDNYKYNGITYSVAPVTRIKNVMSGVLLTMQVSYKQSC